MEYILFQYLEVGSILNTIVNTCRSAANLRRRRAAGEGRAGEAPGVPGRRDSRLASRAGERGRSRRPATTCAAERHFQRSASERQSALRNLEQALEPLAVKWKGERGPRELAGGQGREPKYCQYYCQYLEMLGSIPQYQYLVGGESILIHILSLASLAGSVWGRRP